jgi:hypothetical protein
MQEFYIFLLFKLVCHRVFISYLLFWFILATYFLFSKKKNEIKSNVKNYVLNNLGLFYVIILVFTILQSNFITIIKIKLILVGFFLVLFFKTFSFLEPLTYLLFSITLKIFFLFKLLNSFFLDVPNILALFGVITFSIPFCVQKKRIALIPGFDDLTVVFMFDEWIKNLKQVYGVKIKAKQEPDPFENLGLRKFVDTKRLELNYVKSLWSTVPPSGKTKFILVSTGVIVISGVLIYTGFNAYTEAVSLEIDLASCNQRLSMLEKSLDLEVNKSSEKYNSLISRREEMCERINILLEKKSQTSHIAASSLTHYKKK